MAKKYCSWDVADIKRAIGAFRRGDMGLNQAAERYEVPKATLSRHEKNQNKIVNEDVKFYGGMSCLGGHLEKELVDHCLTLEERFFGLTMNELRELAFELAEANGIAHNFFKDEKMAGKKWYYLFMKRHPELSPRQPESTSMALTSLEWKHFSKCWVISVTSTKLLLLGYITWMKLASQFRMGKEKYSAVVERNKLEH